MSPPSSSSTSVPTGTSSTRSAPSRPVLRPPAPLAPACACQRACCLYRERSPSWVVALTSIEPPRPPSPPSGPPWGMNGSRRKEAEPRPPCPARRTTRAESTNARRLVLLVVDDAGAPGVLAHSLVANLAGDEGEKRVVAAQTDPGARVDPGPALADEDCARVHSLARVDFHAQHLRLGVAPVAGRAATFLVSHLFRFLL